MQKVDKVKKGQVEGQKSGRTQNQLSDRKQETYSVKNKFFIPQTIFLETLNVVAYFDD